MRIRLALVVALCVSCASPAPKSAPATAGDTAPAPQAAAPAAAGQPSVIVTTDPHAVMGCRLLVHTTEGYDIREPDQWRKLQEETARRGGNTALVSVEGDRKADIFSCAKP
jgi:hypothetical protein